MMPRAQLLTMQATALQSVFLCVEGLEQLAAEAAVNAVIDVARTALRAALGIALL